MSFMTFKGLTTAYEALINVVLQHRFALLLVNEVDTWTKHVCKLLSIFKPHMYCQKISSTFILATPDYTHKGPT